MKIEGELLEKLVNAGIEITQIKKEIITDDEQIEVVKVDAAKFACAREFKLLNFTDKINLATYLDSDFEHYKFIKDYEAIWSANFQEIECELQSLGRVALNSQYIIIVLWRLAGNKTRPIPEDFRIYFEDSTSDIKISIGYSSAEFNILSFLKNKGYSFENTYKKATLKIENVDLFNHDQAKNILEKLGNSLLFKLDLNNNLNCNLSIDREYRRLSLRRKKKINELDFAFPAYEYDSEPISLYWYSKSAQGMPLLQFLALYQILEFYFPIFSQKEAHHQVKNLIKDPRFDPNKDSDITRILNAVRHNKNQLGFGSELDQLKSTLQNCISSEELLEFIENDNEIYTFFKEKKHKGLSAKNLTLDNKKIDLISECAERIYEIRCRVVHTKAADKNYDLLLPSSSETKNLIYDIAILDMIAKKVLITTSRRLRVN